MEEWKIYVFLHSNYFQLNDYYLLLYKKFMELFKDS